MYRIAQVDGVTADANRHAAAKIAKEIKKTDEQKLADSFNAAARALQQSGGGHAPPTTPVRTVVPSGGGNHDH